jgi:pimeloyl-ACP methyl ester carboxylesterase
VKGTRPCPDPGSFGHLDIAWEDPGITLFCRTLASFCRLIVFDRRGTGLSDPLPPDPLPPWESYAEELAAVLDVVGAERAALLSEIDAGPTAIFFATTQPERTSALILSHTTARLVAADDYPIGIPPEVAEALLIQIDQLWGSEAMAAMLAPSRAGDERFRRWFGKMVRAGASPRAAQRLLRAFMEVDVRPALPLIQAPTLVMHRRDSQLIPAEHGRYLAEHIPRARLVELAGTDATIFWESPDLALDHVEAFLAGVRRVAAPTRVLTTGCCSRDSFAVCPAVSAPRRVPVCAGQAVAGRLLFWRGRRGRTAPAAPALDPGLRPRFFSVLPTPCNLRAR